MEEVSEIKSFICELEEFYQVAWQGVHQAGCNEDEVAFRIIEASREVGGLMPDYVKQVLCKGSPLMITLMRQRYRLKEELPSLGMEVETWGVWDLLFDVVGVIDVPSGRGGWLYGFAPEYGRFFVVRVMPNEPHRFARSVRFNRVIIEAREGSLQLIPALGKAYRNRPRLSFRPIDRVRQLPHISPRDTALMRQGLVVPDLVVETAIPSPRGPLPGLGFIAVIKGADITWRPNNRVELRADGLSLVLDSSYAAPNENGGSAVSLIFFRTDAVDGYYLGSLRCEEAEWQPDPYIPSNLFVELEGRKVSDIVSTLPNNLLRCYEPVSEADMLEYMELRRQFNLTRRRALVEFYNRRGTARVRVPNPSLMSYKEFRVWVRGVRRG